MTKASLTNPALADDSAAPRATASSAAPGTASTSASASASKRMIQTRDLTVSYGDNEALHATSLEFEAAASRRFCAA